MKPEDTKQTISFEDEVEDAFDDEQDNAADEDGDFDTRDYRPEDAPAVIQIFRDAINEIAAEHYSAEQRTAWACSADDAEAFTRFLAEGWIRVAEDDEGLLGFAQMNFPGELAMLYTAPRAARCGIATALLEDMMPLGEAMGAAHIDAHASALARGLLERFGFVSIAEEVVERAGVQLSRTHMRRTLQSSAPQKKKARKA